jgi:hypothetical protein
LDGKINSSLCEEWSSHIPRFSASNASRVYRATLSNPTYSQPSDWGLSNNLTTNQVWDSFVILSLLEDGVERDRVLSVPHTGDQADRFKPAMEERSQWIVLYGQPGAVRHVCDLCMRVFLMPDGSLGAFTNLLKCDNFKLKIIVREMSGNCRGWFEHGTAMLWCIQVPGTFTE